MPSVPCGAQHEGALGLDGEHPDDHRCGYIAVVGMPNAGKSTLSNRLLGQRFSIVTRKPNTTRNRIVGIRSDADSQLVFLDTPGVVTKQRTLLDSSMMRSVTQAVRDADALLLIVDASDGAVDSINLLRPPDGQDHVPVAVVLNKTDLLERGELPDLVGWVEGEGFASATLPTCSKTGEGVSDVVSWCKAAMPEGPPLYPADLISDHPERFFVAEIVREKILLQYAEEVPYASHVAVLDFKERAKGKDYVAVEVIVERETQKRIIIGKQGSALKKLATASRLEIEEFLGRPVYLDMHVKVSEGWRKSAEGMKNLGFMDSMGIS